MIHLQSVSVIVVSLILSGCQLLQPPVRVSPLKCDLPSENTGSQKPEQSKAINIEIKVDKTPSMQGFAKPLNSYYDYSLKLLDTAATVSGVQTKTDYYVFGVKSQIIDKLAYLDLQKPESYQATSNFLETHIDTAISEYNPDRITVIVTDLYQEKTDVNSIINKIKNNYIKQTDYAVGIVGIRSEFNGIVYDVGITAKQFTYNRTKPSQIKEFRPFYVLVLGRYQNVNNYIAQFQKDYLAQLSKSDSESKNSSKQSGFPIFTIFSPQLVEKPSFISTKNKSSELSGLVRQEVMWVENSNRKNRIDSKQEKIQLLGVTGENNTESKIDKQVLYYYPLPYTIKIDQANPFRFNINVGVFDPINNNFNFHKIENNLKETISFSNWQIANNEIIFTTSFLLKEIPKGTYFFQVDLIPQSLKDQELWNTWNADDGNFNDGAKTNNLNNFLTGLKGVTQEVIKSKQIAIGRLCYVIQKN